MQTRLRLRWLGRWFAHLAKLYLGEKPAFALVALVAFAAVAQAQETLIAIPTSRQNFPISGKTGFTINTPADMSGYLQASGTFDPGEGWCATVWAVLNTDWRENNMAATSLRYIDAQNGAFQSSSSTFDITSTAATRNIFIGGEARTAYRVRLLTNWSTGTFNWQFWGNVPSGSPAKCVDFFVIQFRIVGAESGEGTGVVVEPGTTGLEDPDDFEGFEIQTRVFSDVNDDYDSFLGQKLEFGTFINDYQWSQKLGIDSFDGGTGTAFSDWNYHIPVYGTAGSTFNLNPNMTGATIGGGYGTLYASKLNGIKGVVRSILLIISYSVAAKRVVTLLIVG